MNLNLDENMSPIINFFDKTCKMQTVLEINYFIKKFNIYVL